MYFKTLMYNVLPSTYPETADEQEDKNFQEIIADKPEKRGFSLTST